MLVIHRFHITFVVLLHLPIHMLCQMQNNMSGWGPIHIQTASWLQAQDQALLCHQSRAGTRQISIDTAGPLLVCTLGHTMSPQCMQCTERRRFDRRLVFSANWFSFSTAAGESSILGEVDSIPNKVASLEDAPARNYHWAAKRPE